MPDNKPMIYNEKLMKQLEASYDLDQKEKDTAYQVNEIFDTVQGEGILVGAPATFVRLQGCPVNCTWCDTKYTWATTKRGESLGERLTAKDIADRTNHPHVVITGGEPTIWNLTPLIDALTERWGPNTFLQLETSGLKWRDELVLFNHITWSPKESLDWDGPKEFYIYSREIKLVIDHPRVLHRALEMHNYQYSTPTPLSMITLMPEGSFEDVGRPETVKMILDFLKTISPSIQKYFRYTDRIQYRIGVS